MGGSEFGRFIRAEAADEEGPEAGNWLAGAWGRR